MQEPTKPHATASEELLEQSRLGPMLSLSAGRARVSIAASFLVLASVPGIAGGARRMALCALLVLFTALVHELGHALVALSFGHRVTIVLHALGAHTRSEPKPMRARAALIALAGPCASLLAGAAGLGLQRIFALEWLEITAVASFGWGAINFLPFLPFDAGRALVTLIGEKRRAKLLAASVGLASMIAVEALLVEKNALLVLLFGIAAGASAIACVHQRRIDRELALDLPAQLVTARALLARGELEDARRLAMRVGVRASTPATANTAWELVAWAELAQGLPERAYGSLGRVHPLSDVDDYALAAVTAALGRPREAMGLLERSLQRRPCAGAVKLLIDLHARVGAFERACEIAAVRLDVLEAADARRVIEAASNAGSSAAADRLAHALAQREAGDRPVRVRDRVASSKL